MRYDGTVRDVTGKVYQIIYGEDGFDLTRTIRKKGVHHFCDIERLAERLNYDHERKLNVVEDIINITENKTAVSTEWGLEELEQRFKIMSVTEKDVLIDKIREKTGGYSLVSRNWSIDELNQRLEALDDESW